MSVDVQKSVPSADWVFSEHAVDHGDARARCDLCGRKNLRFRFLLRHAAGAEMWVGSGCVGRFLMSVSPPDPATQTALRHRVARAK